VSLADLSDAERRIVRECLRAAVEGSFFPDWEFHTLFGLERGEVRRISSLWPALDEADESAVIAINNSLTNLLGYPATNGDEEWPKFISMTPGEVARIFDKWRGKSPRTSTESQSYFDDLT
jgi:hypothetical protein